MAVDGWLAHHAVALTTLDPDAPLDDLEPLRDIIGGAQVVAVGESAHFVREFTLARQRILRFLAERCGFTLLALEFGFSEGLELDPWIQGAGTETDLTRISENADTWGIGELLRFVRGHNASSGRPVRFAGIDIPQAGGSLLPALVPVAEYLQDVDPDAVPLAESAIGIAARLAGGSGASAVPARAELGTARQDALTAALARLRLRFRALEPLYVPRSDQHRYDTAMWRLEAAVHADDALRATAALFDGTAPPADLSVRDRYMAESVRWHLSHSAPGTRVVLAAHNNHIQKHPVAYDGRLTTLPMGRHLHRALGDDYFALALTSTADRTVEMRPDPNAPLGFTIADTPLDPPKPGSVEAAALDAGIGPGLIDLRHARGADRSGELTRIRTQSTTLTMPIPDAFDAVLVTPTATMQEGIGA
ncbi:erythromycin esterase family protein [Actinomadura kijaniata]|uniref:erythromycin esterase family protein n=1 Tax=Actinomadura kijaniata TaxID=46161 RepID=UPI00083049CB|nr:erythromycin esterase family protein [Actinomadura kijaniata]